MSQSSRSYQERFAAHFEDHIYRPETEAQLKHAVKFGNVSAQTCLEIIEIMEADRRATDADMNGLAAPDWYAECDRVFLPRPLPGQIGSVVTNLSLFEVRAIVE